MAKILFSITLRKTDSVVYSPQRDRSLPSLVSFVLRNIEDSTRMLHIADVCSHNCVLRNLRHSLTLQQELSRKFGRLQLKFQEITQSQTLPCSDGSSSINSPSSNFNSIDREKDSNDMQKILLVNNNRAVIKSQEYYSCLSVNYLKKRLQETRLKMETVKKLIWFLQNNDNSMIHKSQLLNLMPQR